MCPLRLCNITKHERRNKRPLLWSSSKLHPVWWLQRFLGLVDFRVKSAGDSSLQNSNLRWRTFLSSSNSFAILNLGICGKCNSFWRLKTNKTKEVLSYSPHISRSIKQTHTLYFHFFFYQSALTWWENCGFPTLLAGLQHHVLGICWGHWFLVSTNRVGIYEGWVEPKPAVPLASPIFRNTITVSTNYWCLLKSTNNWGHLENNK